MRPPRREAERPGGGRKPAPFAWGGLAAALLLLGPSMLGDAPARAQGLNIAVDGLDLACRRDATGYAVEQCWIKLRYSVADPSRSGETTAFVSCRVHPFLITRTKRIKQSMLTAGGTVRVTHGLGLGTLVYVVAPAPASSLAPAVADVRLGSAGCEVSAARPPD